MNHPPARRERLRKAGLSMGSELLPDQIERVDSAPENMSGDRLRAFIMHGPLSGLKVAPAEGDRVDSVRRRTANEEALAMLRSEGAMHYQDLADALIASGRVTTKGKTFGQTLSAYLSRAVKEGEVERVSPGVYAAKED